MKAGDLGVREPEFDADRLVENSEIFLLSGDSLRKAGKNPSSPED